MYRFSGLFGQLVTVFPTQDIVVVRTGQDPGLVFAGGADWEHELYTRVLGAITDQKIDAARPGAPTGPAQPERRLRLPERAPRARPVLARAVEQDPLPPAGPGRARAARLRLGARARAGRRDACSPASPARRAGPAPRRASAPARATLTGARRALAYRLAPGHNALLRFRLTKARLSALRRARTATLELVATNRDPGGGTPARLAVTVTRPLRVPWGDPQ